MKRLVGLSVSPALGKLPFEGEGSVELQRDWRGW
jgi:hypothetical protein